MRHILKTTAIASSLVAASFFVGTGMAKAVDAVVPFTGNVAPTCAFGTPSAGTLILDGFATLTSTGATAGSVEVTCNGLFDLSVAAPAANGAPANGLTIASSTASAAYGANEATVGTSADGLAAVTAQAVAVNMSVTADATIPAANGYAYNVTVTALPN